MGDIVRLFVGGSRPHSIYSSNQNLKKVQDPSDTVPAEMLFAILNNGGRVTSDDYLAQARLALQAAELDELENARPDQAITLIQSYRLLRPGYLDIEHGITRTLNGGFYIAAISDLGDCTGDMIEWWVNYCDDSKKFQWMHPDCNLGRSRMQRVLDSLSTNSVLH